MESMEVPEGLAALQSVLDWLAAHGSIQPQTSITESRDRQSSLTLVRPPGKGVDQRLPEMRAHARNELLEKDGSSQIGAERLRN